MNVNDLTNYEKSIAGIEELEKDGLIGIDEAGDVWLTKKGKERVKELNLISGHGKKGGPTP